MWRGGQCGGGATDTLGGREIWAASRERIDQQGLDFL